MAEEIPPRKMLAEDIGKPFNGQVRWTAPPITLNRRSVRRNVPGYLEKPPRTDKEFILNRAYRVMERWGRPWGRNPTVECVDTILTGDRHLKTLRS